jgi:hypothetical protein
MTVVRRPRARWWWQPAVVAVAGVLTVALTQNTTGAVFMGQTVDTNNQLTAAPDFCTAPGRTDTVPNATYPTVVDTAIYESQAGLNFYTDPKLGVVATSPGRVRTLIKFQLPTKPSGCVVTSATLKLHVTNGAVGASIVVYRAAAAWTQNLVTWNTDPGVVAGSGTGSPSTAALTTTPLNVAAQVTGLYAGPDYGFELRDAAEGPGSGANLYDSTDSTTSAYRPQLEIIWG